MEDKVRSVLVILAKGLPDVMELSFIPPDSVMYSQVKLSRVIMAALTVLAQDRAEVSLDRLLEFLLEVRNEIREHPELWTSVGIAA